MSRSRLLKYIYTLLLPALASLLTGCSDKGSTSVDTDVVTDPYPLAVGNYWEYRLTQSIFVESNSDSLPDWSLSSTGSQRVSITRTESITGDEAFGVSHHHVMGYLADPLSADTTVEVHYLAPRGDRILLKGILTTYNTGGFIPFSLDSGAERLVARVGAAGSGRYIPLTRLARQLLEPVPAAFSASRLDALLASDGVVNLDEFFSYEKDYLFVFNELFKGRHWVSVEAGGVGGVDISQKVTNILPSLSGFEGPIAEVEMYNTFVDYAASEQYKIRYYYKSGVGIIQAELSDPEFFIWLTLPNGEILFLGIGRWTVIKELTGYQVK
ncbi:MAG: hypothetical protein JXQ83_13650 [Candidatus Glassbacteria bacterium]|nr:hypothetical protein [Candidatus Glassbacteria bacterium]